MLEVVSLDILILTYQYISNTLLNPLSTLFVEPLRAFILPLGTLLYPKSTPIQPLGTLLQAICTLPHPLGTLT